MLSLISEGFLVLFGNEVGFFLPFLQNAFASYQLVCISQTVCSIYVVELKHDSIRNSIHAASYRDTLFSLIPYLKAGALLKIVKTKTV